MVRFSILQDERKCLVCGTTQNIHIHEVYFGRNRLNSIKQGCCVYLCGRHHNQSNEGIHFNKELDDSVKKIMQIAWKRYYGKTTNEFIEIFRRNYL